MSLIVEDGSIVTGAESYASLAEISAVLAIYGQDTKWGTYSQTLQENAARAATLWIDDKYGAKFSGSVVEYNQPLQWPRYGGYRNVSQPILLNEIPAELKRCLAFVAYDQITGVDIFKVSNGVQSESVGLGSGALAKSVTYVAPKMDGYEPIRAQQSLRPLLSSGGGSITTARG